MIMVNLALTIGVEILFLAYAIASREAGRLVTYATVNMLAVSLYAPRMFAVEVPTIEWELVNNIPAVFYSFVVLAQVCIFVLHGKDMVLKCIVTVFYALIFAIALSALVRMFPVISDDPAAAALYIATDRSNSTVAASFIGFISSQLAMLAIMSMHRMVLAVVLAQIIDSVLFYPLAFYRYPVGYILELMVIGVVFKLLFSAIAAGPVVLILRYRAAALPMGDIK